MPLETAWGLTAAICSFAALRISCCSHQYTAAHQAQPPSLQTKPAPALLHPAARQTTRHKAEQERIPPKPCSLVAPYHQHQLRYVPTSRACIHHSQELFWISDSVVDPPGGTRWDLRGRWSGEARFLSSARDSSAPTTPELACAPRVRLPPRSALERGATT